MTTQPPPGDATPPQYSPDGRWWWTGTEWIPAPPPPARQTGTPASRIMLGVLGAVAVIFLVGSVADQAQKSDQQSREFNERYCATYGC